MMDARDDRATPTLFGFPIHVRPGFLIFLLLIVFLYGGDIGVWVAGSIAIFTVVHELGHAFAARYTGAEASISLDFLMAYAAFRPSRELRWWERLLIAVSGPMLQVTTGAAALVAMGVNPLSRDDVLASDASLAVWWAGIALGLLNLVPVLPLDGGSVVASLIDAVAPGRGRKVMMRASIAVTATAVLVMLTSGVARSFAPFAAFLLIFQMQLLGATNALRRASHHATGDPLRDDAVIATLIALEEHGRAAEFGTDAWRKCPAASTAVLVAQAHAGGGEPATALPWLETAVASSLDAELTLQQIDEAPEFAPMRDSSEYRAIRERLTTRAPRR